MEKGTVQFLREHADKNAVSFHMPGHKGGRFYKENGYGGFLNKIMDCDITEIAGADNLFQPETIIRQTMKKYKKLYGTIESYLLINGSSAGIIAAILATVHKGGKLIMARNCHKSIFNALRLGNIEPVYVYPETVEDYGIQGEISPQAIEEALKANPEAAAVILPSPNYYGLCSDIKAISRVVHSHGKVLIIDQAHGAHLKFFGDCGIEGFPQAAEDAGADIVINSTHKTLGSFTQTAVLNVCTERADRAALEDMLQTLESSSPSYLLMASLDINADILMEAGDKHIEAWAENTDRFYAAAKKIAGLRIMEKDGLDRTKINLDMSALGLSGDELESLLAEKNIFVELVSGNMIMCMSGIGNRREDYEKLIDALEEISLAYPACERVKDRQSALLPRKLTWRGIPENREEVQLKEAAGRTCAASLIPYPPGIPAACPGEVLTEEAVEYISELRAKGHKVIGVSEKNGILVGKEKPV